MTENKLSEKELNEIREEAEKECSISKSDKDFGIWENGYITGRINPLTRERERVKELEEWKRQQLLVMEKLDLQAIGKELEIGLGEDISIRVLPEIRRLKGIIQQLQSK